jgi:flagellar hook-length control protein FliK
MEPATLATTGTAITSTVARAAAPTSPPPAPAAVEQGATEGTGATGGTVVTVVDALAATPQAASTHTPTPAVVGAPVDSTGLAPSADAPAKANAAGLSTGPTTAQPLDGAGEAATAAATNPAPTEQASTGATPVEPATAPSIAGALEQASDAPQTGTSTATARSTARASAASVRAQATTLDGGDRWGARAAPSASSPNGVAAQARADDLPSVGVGADAGSTGSAPPDPSATVQPSGALAAALSSSGAEQASELGVEAPMPTLSETGASAAQTGPVLAAGVQMQDMIDSIRATVEIASRQGIAQARISLQPEELGHISIRLSQTSDGLLARVSAETPAAAQALAAGRAELHQTLSSLGVSLLRLDIGSFGQSEAQSREGRFAGSPQDSRGTSGSSASEEPEEIAAVAGAGQGGAPTGAPRGELIDVLA